MPRYPQYFHIGVPKSGTSTLQGVLGDDPRIHVVRSRHFNTSRFYLEPYPEAPADRALIESDENLVKSDGVFSRVHVTLARIHEASPDAHIILTIREQRSLVLSGFKHNLRVGLPEGKLTDFLLSPRGTDYIAFAQYATLLELIGLHFPKDHVHVVPFEWLRDEPARFFGCVYEVLGLAPPPDLQSRRAQASLAPAQLELLGRLGALRRAGMVRSLSTRAVTGLRRLGNVGERVGHDGPAPAGREPSARGAHALSEAQVTEHNRYRAGATVRTLPKQAVTALRKLGDVGDRISHGSLQLAARERFAWGDDALCRALEAEYRAQNRRVAAQTGIDLAALGYLV